MHACIADSGAHEVAFESLLLMFSMVFFGFSAECCFTSNRNYGTRRAVRFYGGFFMWPSVNEEWTGAR